MHVQYEKNDDERISYIYIYIIDISSERIVHIFYEEF
jgi:hypothetical protein